jgi:cation:H+ antiporter
VEIIFSFLIVAVGFVLLIKGADFLVDGASSLAARFNISQLTIGLTIVAMGTSAPELVVSLVSGVKGYNDVVFGNIIGSNIFNILLILGVAGTIYPLTVQSDTVWKEIPFSLGITILLYILVNDHWFTAGKANTVSFEDGIVLLCIFAAFLYYIYLSVKKNGNSLDEEIEIKQYKPLVLILLIIGGLAGLVFGGKLVVDNAVKIARYFEMSEKLIGLTIIAAGTSLPELATSAVAAFRKKADIAVGNIVGSNIFNILLVLGVSSLVSPIRYNQDLNTDVFVLLVATVLLFIFMFSMKRKKLDRAEAILFLIIFVCYMAFLFIRK